MVDCRSDPGRDICSTVCLLSIIPFLVMKDAHSDGGQCPPYKGSVSVIIRVSFPLFFRLPSFRLFPAIPDPRDFTWISAEEVVQWI